MTEYLITNAIIYDGRNTPPFQADVYINNGRIQAIAKKLKQTGIPAIIDAQKACLSPGFIDAHSHSDISLLAAPEATGKISQGITTDIAGNCGLSAFPITKNNKEHIQHLYSQYDINITWSDIRGYATEYNKRTPAINLASLLGHNTLRASIAGYDSKALSAAEINILCDCLSQHLNQGALGLSTGLLYVPGIFSDKQELIKLASELAPYRRPYTTHLRSEGANLIEALTEAISTCKQSGQHHLHISHLKVAGQQNWHKIDQLLAEIDSNMDALEITADRYPYTESMTQLSIILPSPYDELSDQALQQACLQPDSYEDILIKLQHLPESRWQTVRLVNSTHPTYSEFIGKTFNEISQQTQISAPKICAEILRENTANAMAAFSGMSPNNMTRILKKNYVCCGTDESARPADYSIGRSHPRGFGSFPRFINTLANQLSLEEIIHKLTGLPARIFRLAGRGVIEENSYADLVLFDPETLLSSANFATPHQISHGIKYVWVNGQLAFCKGELTGKRNGRFLTPLPHE